MKFSIALTAVFLPAFVNAQYGGNSPSSSSSSAAAPSASASNSNNINVRLAFVLPSIFTHIPQVSVGTGGALVYTPSAITAANGTSVTFVFAQYNFSYVGYCNDAHTFRPQERPSFRHTIHVRESLHVFGSGQRLVWRFRFRSTDRKAVYPHDHKRSRT
jgi:plastocyanin